MINVEVWMIELTEKLKERFKNRLLFVGLQGSYQRNEAHEDSDIDVVVVFDKISSEDLVIYRELLKTMSENDKTCGFICGKEELLNWPKHELFQFQQDTRSYYGMLHDLLPDISRHDVVDGVKIGTSVLYHSCCHLAIHNPTDSQSLKSLFKNAFFLMQSAYYLHTGTYISTKKDLLPLLEGDELEITNISLNWSIEEKNISENSDYYFALLLRWATATLNSQF